MEKKAFTLAEVLITLGITGVVAALTMPPLIQNYKKKEASTRLKKIVSTMNQAILLSQNENGPLYDWEIGPMNDSQSSYDFIEKYLKPYIVSSKIKPGTFSGMNTASIYFPDGSVLNVKIGLCYDMHFDINGDKGPNTTGKDIFSFILCRYPGCGLGADATKFTAFWCQNYAPPETREEILNLCKSTASECSMLLQHDNWEFSHDYPYKL